MYKFDKNKQDIVRQALETLMCQRHPGNYPTVTFDENDVIQIRCCCEKFKQGLLHNLPGRIDQLIADWAITEHYRRLCEEPDYMGK